MQIINVNKLKNKKNEKFVNYLTINIQPRINIKIFYDINEIIKTKYQIIKYINNNENNSIFKAKNIRTNKIVIMNIGITNYKNGINKFIIKEFGKYRNNLYFKFVESFNIRKFDILFNVTIIKVYGSNCII